MSSAQAQQFSFTSSKLFHHTQCPFFLPMGCGRKEHQYLQNHHSWCCGHTSNWQALPDLQQDFWTSEGHKVCTLLTFFCKL